jgi:hypothetical protein
MGKVAQLIFLFLFFSSCSSDVANRYYLKEHFPPKDTKDVQILLKKPDKEYVVIADFQARHETQEKMRERAAEIGADAVIVTILGGYYSRDEEWAEVKSDTGHYTRIIGTAIKFKLGGE